MRRFAISLLAVLASCGLSGDTSLPPPTVDVSGGWGGDLDSTTPNGEPVYGTYEARFSLLQNGADVTGTYSADITVFGRITSGFVTSNRVQLTVSTGECPGTMTLTGTVRQPANGAAQEMDVTFSGKTACAGERLETGTLVQRSTATAAP